MSWRIRMDVSLWSELKWRQPLKRCSIIGSRACYSSKIQFRLTPTIPIAWKLKSGVDHRRLNVKRLLSKEAMQDKKQKRTYQSPGFILVCGQNVCGQLGLSTSIVERRKPQHLKIVNESTIEQNIERVCAGAMHSCAQTTSGQVYTWGCNDDGALGRLTNDLDDEYVPRLMHLTEEVKSISAGDSFTVVLCKSGRVYISGCFRSTEGLLGLFECKQVAQQPIMIPLDESIKNVICGADFCLLLTEKVLMTFAGELYSFGNNEIGQLGRDAHPEMGESITDDMIRTWLHPTKIPFFRGYHVLNVWAGGHGFFALCQSSKIRLFSCGANSFSQLGHSSKQPIYLPTPIDSILSPDKIVSIACGLQHTLLLDSTGHVYGLGRSDDGRLGNNSGDITLPKQIKSLENIIKIAAGGSVSFAIDNQGRTFSFGMGDTLQTGHGNQDISVPQLIEGKQLENRIVQQISVGAQHTLFLVEQTST